MATDIVSWAPYIHTHIEGCPVPAILLSVREAAIEFCEKTLLWTYDLARISVVADQNNYSLTIPGGENGEIISIDDVKYKQDGLDDDQFTTLDPISQNQMDLHYNSGSWKFLTASTPSNYWTEEDDPETLYLWKTPTEASTSGLLVRCNLRPLRSATTLQDFLFKRYVKTIRDGAIADLLGMKAMPWFDPAASLVWGSRFRTGISNASTAKITGATKRPLRVKMRDIGT